MKEVGLLSRRTLLKGGAAAGAVFALGGAASFAAGGSALAADEGSGGSSSASAQQYGFLVDVSKCVGCKNCVSACRTGNSLPESYADRRWVEKSKTKAGKTRHLSHACMHCEDAACVNVCPAGALSKDEAGSVVINKDRCIGCKYCYQACPYGVPQYNEDGMDKCDTCRASGVAAGEMPNCVQACKFGALQYGPLSDIQQKRGAERLEGPTQPSCYLKYL